ncbi:MAG: cbb3-type cytochrome c oxidase subunit I [Candidatus Bathyarchaeota archaeon]|nr:cbb3-type cytochrome c oxidase subunit I [Candidatus Bathyarchaeota archaeon]
MAYQGFSIKRWLTTTDHKDIGILYIVTSIYFIIVGGSLAELVRIQLAVPSNSLLVPATYEQTVTLHGLIMILWFLSPLGVGLANYFVPKQIGAKDMSFPRLNAMSYWLYLFSGVLLLSTLFLPGGGAGTGWTLYAPLNTSLYSPQPGVTLAALAFAMLAVSVTISSINFITTILRARAKGVTWRRLPAFTWSILMTNILMLFAFPPIAAALVLLTTDRVLGTVFFSSFEGGSILWAQLFWFFGHPEVYIVALPALGIMAEVLVTFAQRPLFGKTLFVIELSAVTALSIGVWIHHMFMTGIGFDVREAFSLTTLAISVPFEGLVLNLVLTLRKGTIKLTTPMLYALGGIFFVILGGITGVFQGFIVLDYLFHGSYWVVGHFHYVMVGTAIFGLVAALYYWFPKITNKMYNEKRGKILFFISFIGFNILYFPYFFLADMPRRIESYAANPQWWPFNLTATIGALIFGPALLLTFANLIQGYRKGKGAEANPWGARETEWTGNFTGAAQAEEGVAADSQKEVSRMEENSPVEKSRFTYLPVTISVGAAVFLTGFVLFWPVAVMGLGVILAAIIQWFKDDVRDKYAVVKEAIGENWPFNSVSKEKVGVWIFLVSEVVLFGSLLTAYIYVRLRSPVWPAAAQVHNITIGTTNTLILLTSSLAMILALQAIRSGSLRGLKSGLIGAFTLGTAFLAVKLGVEWPLEIANGFVISGGLAPSSYFTLMGVHALHVGVGLAGMTYLIAKAFSGRFTAQSHTSVELLGLYWAFVDIVWLILFPLFYLV